MKDQVWTDRNGNAVRITAALGGGFILLVNGFQWGGKVDRSGAGSAVFASVREARVAYRRKP